MQIIRALFQYMYSW